MSEQSHRSDARVLSRRTLQRDHRRLAALLRPGMTVLDVGCGTGAISAGVARAVGPDGVVLGVDRDEALLALARQEHGGAGNLSFECGDVLALGFADHFDVVTAARVIQWVSVPGAAVSGMAGAAKAGGRVVGLDYNHEDNQWSPEPPPEFKRFYAAFLKWRTANGWSNRMADELPGLFRAAGLVDVQVHVDDESAERDDADFAGAVGIWSHVMESLGPKIVAAGHLSERELVLASARYGEFVESALRRQTLCLRTVVGVKTGRSA